MIKDTDWHFPSLLVILIIAICNQYVVPPSVYMKNEPMETMYLRYGTVRYGTYYIHTTDIHTTDDIHVCFLRLEVVTPEIFLGIINGKSR